MFYYYCPFLLLQHANVVALIFKRKNSNISFFLKVHQNKHQGVFSDANDGDDSK